MKYQRAIIALPAVALAMTAPPAAAACSPSLLLDGGFPNGCNGSISHLGLDADGDRSPDPDPQARSADDFTLDEPRTISGIVWYTLDEADGINWAGGARIEVWSVDADTCLPDELIYTGDHGSNFDAGGTVTRTIVQSPGPLGFDRVRYEASGLNIALQAGDYFLALAPISAFPASGASYWETSRCGEQGSGTIAGCPAALQGSVYTDGVWQTVGDDESAHRDLAFRLLYCLADDLCAADLASSDGSTPDGFVNVADLLEMLMQWGEGAGSADIAGGPDGAPDGEVGVADVLALLTSWGDCPSFAANDEPAGAELLPGSGVWPVSVQSASPSAELIDACVSDAPDVWYCVAAECGGVLDIVIDPPIAAQIFTADDSLGCGALPGEPLACSADGVLSLDVTAGQHIKLRLLSEAPVPAAAAMITCTTPPPGGATCAEAIPIAVGESITGDTAGAEVPTFESCSDAPAPTAPARWYTITGDGTTLTADTCSGEFLDTSIAVFCGTCAAPQCIAGNDTGGDCDRNPFTASATFCSAEGATYLIAVWGAGSSAGEFELAITSDGTPCEAEPCTAPGGADDCANAVPIFDGTTPFSTLDATTDGPEHDICASQADPGRTVHDIWWTYEATATGILTVDTCGTADFDTDIVIYAVEADFDCAELTDGNVIGCHDINHACPDFQASVNAPVVAGNLYLIRLGGFYNEGSDLGIGEVTLTVNPPVEVDCPPGGQTEPEPCLVDGGADATNAGCSGSPETYSTIILNGPPVCGTGSRYSLTVDGPPDVRDTDWYLFTLDETTAVTLTGTAEFAATFGIVGPVNPCDGAAFIDGSVFSTLGLGEAGSATVELPPGSYAVFAAQQSGNNFGACGNAIGNGYVISLTAP